MDLRRLKYFVTVVELGSFSKAAALLCISQPPLSQRIQELEHEMGGLLIDRRSRPLKTTVAGELIYQQAREILQRAERMQGYAQRMFNQEDNVIKIGFVSANFHAHLASVVRRFMQMCPDVEVQIVEMNSVQQVEALRAGHIDVGIGRINVIADDIEQTTLYQEQLIAVLPQTNPLAQRGCAVPLAAFSEGRFIVYTNQKRPSLADELLARLTSLEVKPQRIIEVEQYDSALLLIASGYGMTVAPASARLISMPGIAYVPLIETLTVPMVVFHRQESRSRLLQQFFTALDEVRIGAAHANTESATLVGNHGPVMQPTDS
ncbi:MAG: LysR family transcriptional regulator [Yokenella regensburgei]|jgi:DNA-binding transcriptional LysR family regulator|uniref:Ben and cat operon transcriptional regulator n=1 Tax=Yokenella regensburgei TaxID=158877 RepID=A0AB38FRZ8_9ENTR|nr:LysR family transcriptional regulator [Yokenella regensburgei]EHM46305.1 LysR substrate binding domain protein [Yokenella regensburgei ATCC 43003]KAF1368983.1 DNA-binding transcriptional LysR family regulator [Yokenella regensburgei]KFD20766.1 LysR family protein [Yokenella regensburgei ATCC 49455]MDQ4427965.1 LysR family transcriptional regulator [Yokenella regensburgei]MDR3104783.1 LysR family transcriptional regulator [Yokenella regensburgei]